MLPNVNNIGFPTVRHPLNSMQKVRRLQGNGAVSSTADMVSYSFDMMNDSLNNASSVITRCVKPFSRSIPRALLSRYRAYRR